MVRLVGWQGEVVDRQNVDVGAELLALGLHILYDLCRAAEPQLSRDHCDCTARAQVGLAKPAQSQQVQRQNIGLSAGMLQG